MNEQIFVARQTGSAKPKFGVHNLGACNCTPCSQWRQDGGEGGGHSPRAALSRGRHFEGRKYGTMKIGRSWQIDICIAERVVSK